MGPGPSQVCLSLKFPKTSRCELNVEFPSKPQTLSQGVREDRRVCKGARGTGWFSGGTLGAALCRPGCQRDLSCVPCPSADAVSPAVCPQEYNVYGWWVGELDSTVGIVPRDYLAPAYELEER